MTISLIEYNLEYTRFCIMIRIGTQAELPYFTQVKLDWLHQKMTIISKTHFTAFQLLANIRRMLNVFAHIKLVAVIILYRMAEF